MKIKNILSSSKKILWPKHWYGKTISIFALLFAAAYLFMSFIYNPFFEVYTGVENGELSFDSSKELTDAQFEALARELTKEVRMMNASKINSGETSEFSKELKEAMLMNTRSYQSKNDFDHIKYFRKAGIRKYDGPETCLKCHETMKVRKPDGSYHQVNTMEDVLNSIHFRFQSTSEGFSTYGYDGRKVNAGLHKIPVGKIDRACGIPGSFSWTGWAALVETHPEGKGKEMRSEGCGQCHIGGNYHPATEKMMPVGDIPSETRNGVDCLICHSQAYDMNMKHIIKDKKGNRWNQDRSMRAAMTVTMPSNDNCLNCHQHNLGGDAFEHNKAAKKLGYKNKRLLHEGAKRGNPFNENFDVHAKAGLKCSDCHVPQGHKIPRGQKGTDLVANDLPNVAVACENCHTDAPHTSNPMTRVILNGHINRLACETCHITSLQDNNVVLRDWTHPKFNKEEGIYTPVDVYRSGQPNKGFTYLWFNGNGTFLANALGANPNGNKDYNPLMNQLVKITDPEIIAAVRMQALELKALYPDINVEQYVQFATNTLSQMPKELIDKRKAMIEKYIRPIMNKGKSKIYPFKLFNAMMYEDFGNQGPYGAMILPFDYNIYYSSGNTKESVKKAISHPIVKRMYEAPFKYYMMDEFMKYFGVGEWKTEFPLQNGKLKNVHPRWMRQMGTLMINHGITKNAFKCQDCHTDNGIMDFKALGYTAKRVKELQRLPELEKNKFYPDTKTVKADKNKKEPKLANR